MKVLVDTHIALWALADDARLSQAARAVLLDEKNTLHFSAVTIWETAIKAGKKFPDFRVDPREVYDELVINGYVEVPVSAASAMSVVNLPDIHGDPFDRLLVAQTIKHEFVLLTSDKIVDQYPAATMLV